MSRVLIRKKNAPPDSIKISGKIYTDTQMNKGLYEYLYFHSVCPNAYLWQWFYVFQTSNKTDKKESQWFHLTQVFEKKYRFDISCYKDCLHNQRRRMLIYRKTFSTCFQNILETTFQKETFIKCNIYPNLFPFNFCWRTPYSWWTYL